MQKIKHCPLTPLLIFLFYFSFFLSLLLYLLITLLFLLLFRIASLGLDTLVIVVNIFELIPVVLNVLSVGFAG